MKTYVKTGIRVFLTSAAAALLVSTPINAEEFYKTVDKNGNVSYSSVKPNSNKSVEVIPVFPAPSEDTIAAAQEELQQVQQEFEQKKEENLTAKETGTQDIQGSIQAIERGEEPKKAPPLPRFNPFIGLAPFL